MRLLRGAALLAALLLTFEPALLGDQGDASSGDETPVLKPEDAERLFLSFINDRSSLIRSCFFLGGVRIGEISYRKNIATVEIRYRVECRQEEIDVPPLTRTLKENFIYRYTPDAWEILGRANEVSPSVKEGTAPSKDAAAAPASLDPTLADRRMIAEQMMAWAVLGAPPPGTEAGFPGGKFFGSEGKVLVSGENLMGLDSLAVRGREVVILEPEALLQRTILLGGGVWMRFERLEVSGESAEVLAGVLTPVLPGPSPGEAPIRTLTRVKADFYRRNGGWTMTRFRVH